MKKSKIIPLYKLFDYKYHKNNCDVVFVDGVGNNLFCKLNNEQDEVYISIVTRSGTERYTRRLWGDFGRYRWFKFNGNQYKVW